MPGKVFVNYRRDDERSTAARIRDRLAQTFGDANVFMDVDNLLAGQRFDRELEKALDQTDVFHAVIGPRSMELLNERQASGDRDYVCQEIAGALQRGIVVIPVLIERTPLPRADALPEDIRNLALHQAHEVAHARFGRDVADLIAAIGLARKAARAEASGRRSAVRWVAAVTLAALVLGGGVLAYQIGASDRGAEAKRQEDRAKAAAEKDTSYADLARARVIEEKRHQVPVAALSPNVVWRGWHECGGVRVGTAAHISIDKAGQVSGMRGFYSTEGDRKRASGSFRIRVSVRRGQDFRQRRPQPMQILGDSDPCTAQEEGAVLASNRHALAHQTEPYPVSSQIALLGRLGGNEAHRRALRSSAHIGRPSPST